MTWPVRAGIVVAVVVGTVFAVLGAVKHTYHDGTRPGAVHEGGSPDVARAAHKAVVQLPLGALTVAVGTPSQSAPDDVEEKRAADGAAWVPVTWQLAGSGADYDNTVAAFQFSVVLVADGRRYDLQAGQSSNAPASEYTPVVKGKSVDVVVRGPAKHLGVEVGYDGVTQTMDVDSGRVDSGVAAPLYRTGGPRTALSRERCSLLSITDQRSYRSSTADHCTIGAVQLLPYVGGLGWVGSSRESWLVVPVDVLGVQIDPLRRGAEYGYDVRALGYRLTVDGAPPVTELARYRDAEGLSSASAGVVVFRTGSAPRRLTVTLTTRVSERLHLDRRRTFRSTQVYPLG